MLFVFLVCLCVCFVSLVDLCWVVGLDLVVFVYVYVPVGLCGDLGALLLVI